MTAKIVMILQSLNLAYDNFQTSICFWIWWEMVKGC